MRLIEFVDVINTLGVTLILLAFFLLTIRRLKSNSVFYYVLNLVGASLACYGSWMLEVIPFVVLEGTWAVVAAAGLIRIIVQGSPQKKHPEA